MRGTSTSRGGASASQAKDTDDLVSFAGTHEALQAKADIVSASCLLFGLELAVQKKLRCFHLKWCADNSVPDHIIIHLAGWRPHQVPLQNDTEDVGHGAAQPVSGAIPIANVHFPNSEHIELMDTKDD